jgi:hypothetical protein
MKNKQLSQLASMKMGTLSSRGKEGRLPRSSISVSNFVKIRVLVFLWAESNALPLAPEPPLNQSGIHFLSGSTMEK